MLYKGTLLTAILLLLTRLTMATLWLPSFFGNGMVLQQKAQPAIWGRTDKNISVTVVTSWDNKRYTTKSDASGAWVLRVSTPAADMKPYRLTISAGRDQVEFTNVLLGEVWFCSGQSNMEMPVKGYNNQPVLHSNEYLLSATNPFIRLFKVTRAPSLQPQDNVKGEWKEADAVTVRDFSAVGYLFGRLLQEKLQVPVGLIASTYGGTKVQAWMSRDGFPQKDTVSVPVAQDTTKINPNLSTVLFNGMISPLVGYGIKGFIWYQGEGNRAEPKVYEELFPAMVADWRHRWSDSTLPFYYVQIAPYGVPTINGSVLLREVQLKCEERIPHAGMAVITDIGMEKYIHPMEKAPVAERLALYALVQTYGFKGIGYRSPVLKGWDVKDRKAVLSFRYAENGLTSYGKEITQFEVAGEDKVFLPAKAQINRDGSITVWNEQVTRPAAVRYAFKDWIVGELFSTEGLPLSSFRTDNW